jgi:hypothetical protein
MTPQVYNNNKIEGYLFPIVLLLDIVSGGGCPGALGFCWLKWHYAH